MRANPEVSPRVAQVRAVGVDDAVAAALGSDDPRRLAEVMEALQVPVRNLTPQPQP